jgi:DNA-binding transcriptional ArsR family regulator
LTHFADPARDPDDIDVPSDEQAHAAAAGFAMLADPTRLKLLWALSQHEHDVTTLAALVGTSPTTTSQHLAKLRLAGLVSQRPDGKRRLYSIRGVHMRNLIREALYAADHQVSGIDDDSE